MSKREELHQFPLYQKAEQIYKITQGLVEVVPLENEFLQETTVRFMIENAMIIQAKIAGAQAVELYDLKMENATIIRKAARELSVYAGSLSFEKEIIDKEYILLLRKEIDEFRLLFIDWVGGFDKWNYIKDGWGLFNPHGLNAHDKDPDEDIPFNPDDFLNFGDKDDND
jgi:hypothetical protein